MSEHQPVEIARRANQAFASLPFEHLRELILSAESYSDVVERFGAVENTDLTPDLIDPEIEVEIGAFEGGGALAGGGGRGHQAWLRFWQEWLEPWEDLVFEPTSYEEVDGEHVLVDANVTARGRLGGVPAELSVCQLWTIREDRVVGYAVHPSHEQALAAVDR